MKAPILNPPKFRLEGARTAGLWGLKPLELRPRARGLGGSRPGLVRCIGPRAILLFMFWQVHEYEYEHADGLQIRSHINLKGFGRLWVFRASGFGAPFGALRTRDLKSTWQICIIALSSKRVQVQVLGVGFVVLVHVMGVG